MPKYHKCALGHITNVLFLRSNEHFCDALGRLLALAVSSNALYTSAIAAVKASTEFLSCFSGPTVDGSWPTQWDTATRSQQFHALLASNMVLHQPLKLLVRRKPSG